MSTSALTSPVVVDGVVSDEKLSELLALQTEYPELDFKRTIDLSTTRDVVELAKDVGAMQVRGGYIVIGVDQVGAPTGELDGADTRIFDEARLTPKMRQYLPTPLVLRTRVAERAGHTVVLIYVGSHPGGCAFFASIGQYRDGNARDVVVFREGEVFWRDGTRSVRMSQAGLEAVIERRITDAKDAWLAEQREIRRQERNELETAYEGRRLTEGPLGSVDLDMEAGELTAAALEFLRRDDSIGLTHLFNDAITRARGFIERDDVETGLASLLDKLACLAATFLIYDEEEPFERVIQAFTQIYSMPLGERDDERFDFSTAIPGTTIAPRVWLEIMRRIYGIGALAVRRRDWSAVRTLTLQHPERLTDYHPNWLRHTITMASRAGHFRQQQDDGQTVDISLLTLARNDVTRLDCLRADGITEDDEQITSSLAQFDILANLVAIADAGEAAARVYYPNFARFRQDRIQPIVDRLLSDQPMRRDLGLTDDANLATALNAVGNQARIEGARFDGFWEWDRTPVARFIAEYLPRASG
jgi:hypothetical protein